MSTMAPERNLGEAKKSWESFEQVISIYDQHKMKKPWQRHDWPDDPFGN